MWSLVKLVVNAIIEAMVTATAFAIATILLLWGANGFPEASVADFVGLLGWAGGVGTGIVVVLKLVEFVVVARIIEVRGRAFDSAFDRLYSALAERDVESARYWLSKLESRRQPLYDTLSHCAKWRGVNSDVINNLQWQVLDRPRIARDDIARAR